MGTVRKGCEGNLQRTSPLGNHLLESSSYFTYRGTPYKGFGKREGSPVTNEEAVILEPTDILFLQDIG
jgi:hypothetical protein